MQTFSSPELLSDRFEAANVSTVCCWLRTDRVYGPRIQAAELDGTLDFDFKLRIKKEAVNELRLLEQHRAKNYADTK